MKPFRFLLLVLCIPAAALGQSIRIFDQPCGSCEIFAPVGVPTTLTIGFVGGGNVDSIIGVDFRVVGLPGTWTVVVTPPPFINPCGPFGCDVFGEGAHLGFPSCQLGDCLTLFSVMLIPFTSDTDVLLTVMASTGSTLDCPLVTLCDAPAFTKVCVLSDPGYINPTTSHCPVAVEKASWSQIREIYR